MKAIILSAGQGRRLLPLTAEQPKAALRVGPVSVLEWQLREIAQTAINDVVVVTGFGADHIDRIVAAQQYVATRTLYNPFYAECDNLGTCWIARHEMIGPFVIINGDTLFEAAVLQRLLAHCTSNRITLATDRKDSYDADDMKVTLREGLLRRVGKQLESADTDGESIGMMHFDISGGERFRKQVEHMMRYGTGLKQWYLSAIDALASEGIVADCSIEGLGWCEIDDQDDLANAANVVLSWPTRAANARSGDA